MPYYEYECLCGNKFEDLVPMVRCSEPHTCPKCGEFARRVMSPLHWKAFPGTLTYDRMNGYPGGFKAGGTSSGDMKNIATEDY